MTEQKVQIYTWEQVKQHKSVYDCWLVANGIVYDVTPFLSQFIHPGGLKAILKNASTDCTMDFNFHTDSGKLIWKKYEIGQIYNANSLLKPQCMIM
jgi:cytochrome b involved in lipid metabolism